MDGGLALLKFLFPQIPSLTGTAIWHSLGRTPTSSKWDLRTEITVQILRNMMNSPKPQPVSKTQAQTLKDPGVKGKMWVATETIPAPRAEEEGVREAVFNAIETMKPRDAGTLRYSDPGLTDIEVEWTGYRPDASKDDLPPDISEEEKYKKMMAEPSRTGETTILFFHGGAYYLCDPATHRLLGSRLAKETNGRVCNVRYRLAPQTAFPGQMLDVFTVYLSLLYPPPGSMHEAVKPDNIVFGGDSAGGNLTFALLQLLLHLDQKNVRFHGKDIRVRLPAGVTASSGWFDISRSMPSVTHNVMYDYLPPKNDDPTSNYASDPLWPVTPPRGDLFCDLSLLDHPLVSPLVAETWKNSPPLWICTGQEMLRDEIGVVAREAAAQGAIVQLEEYEAMPHVFAQLLPTLPTADMCLRNWGDFCRRCVEEPATLKTNGTFVYAKSGKVESRSVSELTNISLETAQQSARETKTKRSNAFVKNNPKSPKSTL